MTSKAVTREQFEIRSELEVVHIPTGTVFRAQPYIDPRDRAQSIKGWCRAGVPTGDYFKQVQSMAAQLLLEREIASWASRLRTCDQEAAMAWVGRTNFSEIGVGTSLRFRGNPYDPWTLAESSPS